MKQQKGYTRNVYPSFGSKNRNMKKITTSFKKNYYRKKNFKLTNALIFRSRIWHHLCLPGY